MHKTATTYMQEVLALNQDASAAAGTAYWPREKFRPNIAAAIRRHKAKQRSLRVRATAGLASRYDDPIERMRRMTDIDYDVTISEENLLGGTHDCFSGALYPEAETNLRFLKSALPQRPVEILIALRSYDAFASSLFAEALKTGSVIPIEQARAMAPRLRGEFPRLLKTIRTVFPTARFIVWRYEDFAKLEDDLLARMSGLDRTALQKPSEHDVLPSPTGEAINAFLAEATSYGRVERQIRLRALRIEHPRTASSSKFSLWTKEEAAALAQDYARDIEEIKSLPYVDFLA